MKGSWDGDRISIQSVNVKNEGSGPDYSEHQGDEEPTLKNVCLVQKHVSSKIIATMEPCGQSVVSVNTEKWKCKHKTRK